MLLALITTEVQKVSKATLGHRVPTLYMANLRVLLTLLWWRFWSLLFISPKKHISFKEKKKTSDHDTLRKSLSLREI